jgi:arabinoxylan arabinofuranohydrolase
MQRYSIGTYFQVYKSFKRGTLFGQMEEKWKFMKDWHRKKQKVIDSEVKMNFHPRHGTIIPITRAELKRITDKWPSKEMGNMTIPNNPVLQGFHADPEILYSHQTKKYYIYSTTDGQPGWGGWYFSVFSSDNLKDWKDEGPPKSVPNRRAARSSCL